MDNNIENIFNLNFLLLIYDEQRSKELSSKCSNLINTFEWMKYDLQQQYTSINIGRFSFMFVLYIAFWKGT